MSNTTVIRVLASCLCLLGLGHAQTAPSAGYTPPRGNTAELLETAHSLLASLPPEVRIDVLAELAPVAGRTEHPRADQWLEEVERLAEADNDLCRRARYQARMIEALNTRAPAAALQRLAEADSTCPDPLASTAASVFPTILGRCEGKCLEDVMAAAEHLGRLGSYPFTAMLLVSQHISEDAAGVRLFYASLAHYRAASKLGWQSHRSFLSLVERQRGSLSRELVSDALSVAINRIRDQRDDAGLQYVSVLEGGAARQHTDRDAVVAQLYGLAKSVDQALADRVIAQWPNMARASATAEAKMTAGVAVGGNRPLPRSAELALEVERLKPRLAEVGEEELRGLPVGAATRVAVLSLRATQLLPKDPAAASASLRSAARELDKLEDRMERVLAAPYLVEAAVTCKDPKVASRTAELQFEDALALLRELRRENATLLVRTPVYWPLRQTVMALRDRDLALPSILGVRDDELKARLLVALADSLSRAPRR